MRWKCKFFLSICPLLSTFHAANVQGCKIPFGCSCGNIKPYYNIIIPFACIKIKSTYCIVSKASNILVIKLEWESSGSSGSDDHWDFRRYTFLDSVVLQFIRSNNVVTQKTIDRISSLNAQNGNTLNSLHIDCTSLYDSRNVEFTVNVLNKIPVI